MTFRKILLALFYLDSTIQLKHNDHSLKKGFKTKRTNDDSLVFNLILEYILFINIRMAQLPYKLFPLYPHFYTDILLCHHVHQRFGQPEIKTNLILKTNYLDDTN